VSARHNFMRTIRRARKPERITMESLKATVNTACDLLKKARPGFDTPDTQMRIARRRQQQRQEMQ